jgi:NAD(P)-dependent dehydrogenase (short-subunit alcohol dehydrogenase family)
MSSVASITGQKGLSVYSASKGAVDAAARSLASEFADKNLRVNTVVSGAVITEMHDRLTGDLPEESIKDYEDKHLLGFGEPRDIANAALYLLSDASKWVTGTSLVVDGGYSCQ